MKYLIKIFVVYLFLLKNVSAQSLWLFDYGYNAQFNHLVENLSEDSLKNIILYDDWNQSPLVYKGAVTRLYYFHKETESQFLINNLNTEIDSIAVPEWAINLEWDKYYTDAYILGHLGSPTAIDKMRVIANDENNYYRLRAIGHLAETGIYDYYNFLKSEYYGGNEDPYILFLLSLYSRNESYKDEIKSILRNEVYSESDYFGIISRAHYLSFIPGAEVEILDEYFRNTNGKERYDYFFQIGIYDKDGQVERSIFALQNEPNDTFRVEYLPSPDMVISWNSLSKRYLEPMFINFLNGFNVTDQSSMTYQRKEFFLLAFVPVPPDSAKPTLDLLDNLYNYVDSVYNYTWLGDQQFKNELQSIIQSAQSNLQTGDSLACRADVKAFQDSVDYVYADSLNADPHFVTLEGWKFLYWNAQYILDRLPEIPSTEGISTYSIFATHGVWLEQDSEIISGSIGVNEIGLPPFMDSGVELSIGISTETPAGYTIKANSIKVKQGATVNANVYYNELENNGTIIGTLSTPLELPIFAALPEFHTSTPGTQNINVPQNGVQTLQPGSYNNIDVKKNGRLIFTGGEYHINKLTAGDDNQLLFQSESEVRIKDKFDSGQGTYIGPQDTTTMSSDEIIFYVEGINGTNGNLGATPKAAKIGISNLVKANFYVPNGTLWIRQNSEVEGSFIGKDVDVGIGVKVKFNSAF
jgi:hypothetical protein